MSTATRIGLRNLFFAPLTDEALNTYSAPVKISEAIEANVTINNDSTTLYADDRAVDVAEGFGEIEVELNIRNLDSAAYELLMGVTKNADGVFEDHIDDVSPYGALLFELPQSDGGSKLYVYYKGKFMKPGTEATTKGESVEFQTDTISGKFMPREDGKWRAHLISTDTDADPAVVAAWFDAVYAPTPTP